MILFQDDWRKYPTAIVDTKTSNQSFVRYAKLLKKMGIKNHLWPLALIQPALQGVNPHSPDLTDHQKVMIRAEIEINPWYYLREVARIPVSGDTPFPVKANRGICGMWWCFFAELYLYIIQPRQTGKTLGSDILHIYLQTFVYKTTTICYMTKDTSLRKKAIEDLKAILALTPPWLIVNMRDADNTEGLTYNFRENKTKCDIGHKVAIDAEKVFRGIKTPFIRCDEMPYIDNFHIAIDAFLPSLTAGRKIAKEVGLPFGLLQTTTAGDLDTKEGERVYKEMSAACYFRETLLFDATGLEDLADRVRKNSTGATQFTTPTINMTLSHRQVGQSDEELMYNISQSTSSPPEKIERDYFCRWQVGSTANPLRKELLTAIYGSMIPPITEQIYKGNYVIDQYVSNEVLAEVKANSHMIIGCDASEAIGRDDIAVVITDARDLGLLFAGGYNKTNVHSFAEYLADFMIKNPNSTLVIERKSTAVVILGIVINALLAVGINPARRIFSQIIQDRNSNRILNEEIRRLTGNIYDSRKFDKFIGYMGYPTAASGDYSRSNLYVNILPMIARMAGNKVRCEKLALQIRGLINKNGRIDHEAKSHDDYVIAWMLCGWFAFHANDLSFYGISQGIFLTRIREVGTEDMSDVEINEREEMKRKKNYLDELIAQIEKETDTVKFMTLEREIKKLYSEIDGKVEPTINYSEAVARMNKVKQIKTSIERFGQNRDRYYRYNPSQRKR